MTHSARLLVIGLIASLLSPPASVYAQRGEFIEGLFRTIAEAQLEREKLKQQERQREAAAEKRKESESRSKNPYEVQLPSGFDRGNTNQVAPPVRIPPLTGRPNIIPPNPKSEARRGSINVRSREAAEFAGNLVKFNSELDQLVGQLRSQASRQHGLRTLLPEAYAVAADGQSLVRRCDGLSALSPIVDPYRQLDARWRQLSFELRSGGAIDSTTSKMIRQCDQLCSSMARQLQIDPQLDRHALHDLMIQAATYMQALLDDLELARVPSKQTRQLAHDCRLLRQRLLGEADHVSEANYETVVTRFSDFARGWSEFSQQVYSLADPHMNRRLDRIGQCGDQVYALLWMPPPVSAEQVATIAHRLEGSFATLLDQLTLRSMVSLRREDQMRRVLESSRNLYDKARQLETAADKGASRREQQAIFSEILRGWTSLRNTYFQIDAISRGTLAEIDRSCEQLQAALGVAGDVPPIVDVHSLIQAAASLEGSSEYLDADLQRYARYLQPDSYRKSLLEGSGEFHLHAKQLHALLSRPAAGSNPQALAALQREAEHMLDGWKLLSRELSHLDGHGLSSSRADRIKRSQQELVPFVAQVAAALLER